MSPDSPHVGAAIYCRVSSKKQKKMGDGLRSQERLGRNFASTKGYVVLRVFDDDDDRSLIENGCITAAKQPWELGHPPQKHERAVRVHVVCTVLLFAFLADGVPLPGPAERALDGLASRLAGCGCA